MPKISMERLQQYFTANGTYYPVYAETVEIYDNLRIHVEGVFPEKLLKDRRPSEPQEILQYRRDNYQPITKLPISKVISSLGKIKRSPDWSIKYPETSIPSIIPEEMLKEYCINSIPGIMNIENWIFSVLLKNNLIDPNAIIIVIPYEVIKKDVYAKPVPILFNSDQVLEFNEEKQFCILRGKRKVTYLNEQNEVIYGDRYYYVDDKEIIIYEQGKTGYTAVYEQKNLTGKMPAWRVKAEIYKTYENTIVNQSRLHAMVPFLNKAATEDNDLDGSKVQHLYPLFWYYQNNDCPACNGTGKQAGAANKVCTACKGHRKLTFTPFTHLAVAPAKLGENQTPAPPAGFVARDVAILELQEKLVEKNTLKALSAVNMQFLDQTPLSISGDAKRTDREELDNFVYSITDDLVYSADKVFYFIGEWRYTGLIKDVKKRKALLPEVKVPENFDLLPLDYLINEIKSAKEAKVNPLILAVMEMELTSKKFHGNDALAKSIELFYALDPLSGISNDDKMTALSNGGITKKDYLISFYLVQFIKRAFIEDKEFSKKPYVKQMDVLYAFADEKMKDTDEAAKLAEAEKQRIINENAPAA